MLCIVNQISGKLVGKPGWYESLLFLMQLLFPYVTCCTMYGGLPPKGCGADVTSGRSITVLDPFSLNGYSTDRIACLTTVWVRFHCVLLSKCERRDKGNDDFFEFLLRFPDSNLLMADSLTVMSSFVDVMSYRTPKTKQHQLKLMHYFNLHFGNTIS